MKETEPQEFYVYEAVGYQRNKGVVTKRKGKIIAESEEEAWKGADSVFVTVETLTYLGKYGEVPLYTDKKEERDE